MLKPLDVNCIFLDCETTTFNKGHPFDPRNKLVSYVYAIDDLPCIFRYYTDADFNHRIFSRHDCGTRVVGFNIKFDLHWCRHLLPNSIEVWDCQLAEFVYSGQKDVLISLDECLERYGLPKKKSYLVEEYWANGIQTDEIPIQHLKEYNVGDVDPLRSLYEIQQKLLSEEQKALVITMGYDLLVLVEMERNGVLFNAAGATQHIKELRGSLQRIQNELHTYLPHIEHGEFNWSSGDHLSALLYGGIIKFDWCTEEPAVYKSGEKKGQDYIKRSWFEEYVVLEPRFKPLPRTEVKKTLENKPDEPHYYKTDEPTLLQLSSRKKENKRLVELLLQLAEQTKIVEMLESIQKQFTVKQWEHNLIHPQYNQNIVVTGRLSSSNPNMQNQPPQVDQFLVSRYG